MTAKPAPTREDGTVKVIISNDHSETSCKYATRERLCNEFRGSEIEVDGTGSLKPADRDGANLTHNGQRLADRLAKIDGAVLLTFNPNSVIVHLDEPHLWDWESELHPAVLKAFGEAFSTKVQSARA
ncbi:hypothetical protein [Frankia sp. R82]|uniref:hypothetical protein n=1 Tax=Frankia sp. R82 TaxID=2950553 RepID=UPI0020447AAD|nr:hypothetical protein [Frankia sp. R82]MCM3884117.1 hypothetical protein [Frankia sp. R82]